MLFRFRHCADQLPPFLHGQNRFLVKSVQLALPDIVKPDNFVIVSMGRFVLFKNLLLELYERAVIKWEGSRFRSRYSDHGSNGGASDSYAGGLGHETAARLVDGRLIAERAYAGL